MGISSKTFWMSAALLISLMIAVNVIVFYLSGGDSPTEENVVVNSPVGDPISDIPPDFGNATEVILEGFSGSGRGIVSDAPLCDNFIGECFIEDGICTIEGFDLPDEFYVCVDISGDGSYSEDETFGPYFAQEE